MRGATFYINYCVSRGITFWQSEWLIFILRQANDFKSDLERYLADLETSEVRTVQNVIDFNIKNAEKELPPCRY